MSLLELAAAALALINVALVVRRSVWNFPVGLVAVVLYAEVFREARLYSDMLLQGVFVIAQVYGWWVWARGPATNGRVQVRTLDARGRAGAVAAATLASAALGFAMTRYTDAAAPWWDAAIAGFSVTAQWLLARRFVETWWLWIAVDAVAIGVFHERGLLVTSGLYAVFLVMATVGAVAWWRALHGEAGPVGAAA